MKRTAELNTLDIANRLGELDGELHIAQLACDSIPCDEGEGGLVANMIQEIRRELAAIAEEIHPGPSLEEEIDHVRRVADNRITQLKERFGQNHPDGESPETRRAKLKAVKS